MKASIFNSYIFNQGYLLVFNSNTNRFLIIKNASSDFCFDKFINDGIKDAEFTSNLVRAGFIVDEKADEFSSLLTLMKNGLRKEDEITIHVNPTLDCNLHCWYCYEKHHAKSVMGTETQQALCSFIEKSVKDNPKITRLNLGFFGGEPLLFYDQVVKHVIQKSDEICKQRHINLHLSFTTNGTLLNNEMIENLSKFNPSFQITLDGHEESHNRTRGLKYKNSYRLLLDNIFMLARHSCNVVVRINYTTQNVEELGRILNDFNEKADNSTIPFMNIDFQRVWQERERYDDETEELADSIRIKFKNSGFSVCNSRLMNYVKHPCYGDFENYLLVNYNGDIFGCTARDFTSKNSIGKLFKDGSVTYNSEVVAQRNSAKFSKPVCQICRIAPLCGGGCKQRAYESRDDNSCTYGYSESDKDKIILNIFDTIYCCK